MTRIITVTTRNSEEARLAAQDKKIRAKLITTMQAFTAGLIPENVSSVVLHETSNGQMAFLKPSVTRVRVKVTPRKPKSINAHVHTSCQFEETCSLVDVLAELVDSGRIAIVYSTNHSRRLF